MKRKYLFLTVMTSLVIACGVVWGVNSVGTPSHTRLVKEGNVVTNYVDVPTTVTDADLNEAVKIVDEWNQAAYDKDFSKQFTLLYDTFVVPYSKDAEKKWVEQQSQIELALPTKQTQYEVSGQPYTIHNWSTRFENFIGSNTVFPKLQLGNGVNAQGMPLGAFYKYHMVFKQAIAVQIIDKGIQNTQPTILHLVINENGQWCIAYSHSYGFETSDNPENN